MNIANRIEALREQMKQKSIDAFVIFSADPHMSEYLPVVWREREWLSGFTGSAGLVVITQKEAGLWTDSRYFIQAPKELAGSGIQLFKEGLLETPSFSEWLLLQVTQGGKVAVNGLCCPHVQWEHMKKLFATKKITLHDIPLLQEVWIERETSGKNPIFIQPTNYSGVDVQTKIANIRTQMNEQGADLHLVTSLDNIAWILNLRGSDVEYNPVFISYLSICHEEVILFVDTDKCTTEVLDYLEQNNIRIAEYDSFFTFLDTIEDDKVWINPVSNQAIFECLSRKNSFIKLPPPSHLMKSLKNKTEVLGSKKAHEKDGVAMVHFLYWLEQNIGKTPMTEVSIAEKLLSFRQEQENFIGESFGTIAGYQGNGAIVHYSAKAEDCKTLQKEGVLLLDSGGQYLEGTTDITRTIPFSDLDDTFKTDYTLVLKGHIALNIAKFPHGTRGCNLDILARHPLWKAQRNYGHGTGHGVGAFLNVHEGPLNIRQDLIDQAILPGMIMSNEPGLYRADQYGIRLENLMVCVEDKKSEFGVFYAFETITLCPFYTNVIKKELLDEKEINWLNSYHQQVLETLLPHLENKAEQEWLQNMCKAI